MDHQASESNSVRTSTHTENDQEKHSTDSKSNRNRNRSKLQVLQRDRSSVQNYKITRRLHYPHSDTSRKYIKYKKKGKVMEFSCIGDSKADRGSTDRKSVV